MRKIRDVLRLRHECRLSQRQIKGSVGLSKTTIADYLYRAEAAGILWPIPEGIDDGELEKKLFPSSSKPGRPKKKAKLDYEKTDRELRKKK